VMSVAMASTDHIRAGVVGGAVGVLAPYLPKPGNE